MKTKNYCIPTGAHCDTRKQWRFALLNCMCFCVRESGYVNVSFVLLHNFQLN